MRKGTKTPRVPKSEEKDELLGEYMRELGAKGGHARAAKMTAKQRSANAKKAALARWKDKAGN